MSGDFCKKTKGYHNGQFFFSITGMIPNLCLVDDKFTLKKLKVKI